MSYTVDALQDALSVLKIVAHSPGLGVSEIARRSGYTKARTYRFLLTFEAAGFVQRQGDAATYTLGPATRAPVRRAVSTMSEVDLSRS